MVHPGSSKYGFATVEAEVHFIGQHYMVVAWWRVVGDNKLVGTKVGDEKCL
jgi:hypothetical protein